MYFDVIIENCRYSDYFHVFGYFVRMFTVRETYSAETDKHTLHFYDLSLYSAMYLSIDLTSLKLKHKILMHDNERHGNLNGVECIEVNPSIQCKECKKDLTVYREIVHGFCEQHLDMSPIRKHKNLNTL